MGTYYTLGIIEKFTAESEQNLSEENWKQILDERMDLDLFDLTLRDRVIIGSLKNKLFEDNIEDFYAKLKKITNRNHVAEYFEIYKNKIENYSTDRTGMYLYSDHFGKISVDYTYCVLFAEGKVLAETFSIEPMLMAFLFRQSNFGNCLAGCVMSAITG